MPFSLVTTQAVIARNAGALYGTGVGNASMTSYVTQAGTNTDAFLNTVYANSVGTASTATVASVLVTNLGITDTAAAATATNYIVGQLNAVAYTARGAVVNSILTLFSGMTSDATFGAVATAWNTQVSNAVTYAATAGKTDSTFSTAAATPVVSTVGQTFTLTTGVDVVTGTDGNDTILGDFTATSQFNLSDQIGGGTGTDTLKLFGATTALLGSNMPLTITGVETLQFGGAPTAGAYNLSTYTKAASGVTSVIFDNASAIGANTITTTAGQSLTLGSGTAGTVDAGATLTWAGSASDTALNLTLNGFQGILSGTETALTVTGAAATTLNVVSSGTKLSGSPAANQISTLTAPATTTKVVVTGDSSLLISTSLTGANIATVDASAAAGGVDINVAGTAVALTFTGGAGNDTVRFNAAGDFSSADTVNLGAGTNTLWVADTAIGGAATAALNSAINAVTTAQVLGVSGAATVDMSGVTARTLTLGATSNFVVQKLESADHVTVNGVTAGTVNATASLGYNVLNLDLNQNAEAIAATGTLNATSQATINITSNSTGTATTANTIGAVTNSANAAFTVTGSQALSITSLSAAASVNAADFTGILTVTGANAASSIVGGSKADVLTGATVAGGDTIKGGAGNDTINTGAQTGTTATVITGGTGADSINLQATANDVGKLYTINATGAESYATTGQFDTVTFSDMATNGTDIVTLVTGLLSSTVVGATSVTLGVTTVTAGSFLAVGSASTTLTTTNQNFSIYQDTNSNGIIDATDLRVDFTDVAAADTMAITIVGSQIVVTSTGV